MDIEQVKAALHLRPFRPFVLRMKDGKEIRIASPEGAVFMPGPNLIFLHLAQKVNGTEEPPDGGGFPPAIRLDDCIGLEVE